MTSIVDRLTHALAGKYVLGRELGSGGMATVYLAQDLRHDRPVAIKVLKPDLAAVLGAERFVSEIRTTAALQHPHILPLFDSGTADGFLFYVMPYLEGETLRGKLDRERQLGIEEAVRIAREVADALDYAHRHGVIHRDIKPENILLHDGRATVADFGIALAVSAAAGGRMTETGLSLGTPHYMSPEQATAEREITGRSDIYSLGCVLYEMLTGNPPHTGATAQQIIMKIVTEEATPVTQLRKAVPPNVAAAVTRAVERLPADRFESAKAFMDALANPAFTAAATRREGPAGAPGRRTGKGAAGLWLALLATGAAAGWAAGRLIDREGSTTTPLTVSSVLAPTGGTFGEQRSLALTPDGRRLAFVVTAADGSRMLWLRDLDRIEARPLPNTIGARAPFWSPDGRSLGFFAGGYLTVLDPDGDARRLCPVANPTGGSWGTRGQILFGHRGGVSTVPATGGSCRTLIAPEAGPLLRPAFLPDGNRFLYSRGRHLDLAVADLEGAELGTIPITAGLEFAFVAPDYLVVPSRTDILALDVQRINLRTLALEGPLARLVPDVRSAAGVPSFAASPNGVLAYLPSVVDRPYLDYAPTGVLRDSVRIEGTWTLGVRPRQAGPPMVAVAGTTVGVWLYDLDSDRSTRLPVRDTTLTTGGTGAGTIWPVFSADGSHLIHLQVGPGQCRILERNLANDAERVVARDTAADTWLCPFPQSWSTDGRRLLVKRDSILEILALDGPAEPGRIVRPGFIWEGALSPDSRLVAYSSDETGRAEVYVQRLPEGPPIRVSQEGGRWPNWMRAGRTLAFMTPDGRVQEADLGANPASGVGTPRTRFAAPTWRRNTFDDRGTGFAVVADGDHYLVRGSPSGLAVVLIQGWPALLRGKVAAP